MAPRPPFDLHTPGPRDLASELPDSVGEAAFATLLGCLPPQTLEPRVKAFFRMQQDGAALAAAGDPLTALERVVPEADLVHLTMRLRQAPLRVPEAQIHEEALTAQRALVSHWVDTVTDAFRHLAVERRLPLSTLLLPLEPERSSHDKRLAYSDWKNRWQRSYQSVLANVALSSDDLAEVTREFSHNIADQLKAPVPGLNIPPYYWLTRQVRGFELTEAK